MGHGSDGLNGLTRIFFVLMRLKDTPTPRLRRTRSVSTIAKQRDCRAETLGVGIGIGIGIHVRWYSHSNSLGKHLRRTPHTLLNRLRFNRNIHHQINRSVIRN